MGPINERDNAAIWQTLNGVDIDRTLGVCTAVFSQSRDEEESLFLGTLPASFRQ